MGVTAPARRGDGGGRLLVAQWRAVDFAGLAVRLAAEAQDRRPPLRSLSPDGHLPVVGTSGPPPGEVSGRAKSPVLLPWKP